MTETLIVDPTRLAGASAALTAAAAEIPMMPPPLVVSGADALSHAVSVGSKAIELPMAALPRIRQDASKTAASVGTAGQMYASQDEALAAKVAGAAANVQQITEVSATDQLLQNLVTGPGAEVKPDRDTLLGALAAKAKPSAADALLGNLTSHSTSPGADAVGAVLDNLTAAGPAKDAAGPGLAAFGKSLAGDKTDWILGLGGAKSAQILDGVAELTRSAGPENTWVGKAVEEVKLFGTDVKGSGLGGVASVAFAGAAFAKDTGQDHMPPAHAFLRETAALVAGTAFGAPLEVSVVGAPLGVAVGVAASNVTGKVVDTFYYMGKGVADAGGAGQVMKVGRWGWAPS